MTGPTPTQDIGGWRIAWGFKFCLAYSCAVIAIAQIYLGLEQGVFSDIDTLDALFWSRPGPYFSLLNNSTYQLHFRTCHRRHPIGKIRTPQVVLDNVCLAEISGIILLTSHNRWQMVVGRVIGMELALVLARVIGGTSTLSGDKACRIPRGLLFVIPTLLFLWGLPSHAKTASVLKLDMKTGIIAMMTVFIFSFSIDYAPPSHVIAVEIPAQHLRNKIYAVGAVFNITI
ncbi:hypothetical protein P171DRAFT_490918 [Karstenula rhodostoma CBS 690.94]|uniref:Uncharacterized protein n=1 Tax=Karstenula rhodostoma CBS 690.94 TaxID=1392251 RepID=A0A9P4P7W8_9PLEO|nr:hypothetical protein P171DRAFT_490918 [Karstenula rhodostoma CBS 690.94]